MTAKRLESSRNSVRRRTRDGKHLPPMTYNGIFPHACGRSPMPPADVSSSAAFRPARTIILQHPKRNYNEKSRMPQRLFSFPYEFAFPIVDRCKRSGIDVIFYLYLWNKDLPLRRIIRFCNDAIFFRILGMYPNAGRTIQPITNDRTDNKVSCEEHIRETT